MSARKIDRAIGIGVIALAVLLALLPLALKSAPEPVAGSVSSNEARGRRALFLVLAELGFTPEVWNEPPGRLPRGENFLWLARAPHSWSERSSKQRLELGKRKGESKDERSGESDDKSESKDARDGESSDQRKGESTDTRNAETDDEPVAARKIDRTTSQRDASADESQRTDSEPIEPGSSADADEPARDETPAALGSLMLRNYKSFVEEGGTLALRFDDRARRFLCDELELEVFRDLKLDADSPEGVRTIRTESGDDLRADWHKGSTFRPLAPNGSARALWTATREDGADGEVAAVVVPVGSGRVLLLGDDAFLDNNKMGEKDHALLAVHVAERAHPGGRLLFDEFALGLWQPETATSLATSPQHFLITAHLVLLALLLVWMKAWPMTFPRDPPALARVSPLSRARARAGLCARAGRVDLLAAMLKRGSVLRWLAAAHVRGGEWSAARVDGSASSGEPSGARSDPSAARSHVSTAGSHPLPTRSHATPARSHATRASELDADIARIATRVGATDRAREWTEALHRPVVNEQELEALAHDLDGIEAEITARIAGSDANPSPSARTRAS